MNLPTKTLRELPIWAKGTAECGCYFELYTRLKTPLLPRNLYGTNHDGIEHWVRRLRSCGSGKCSLCRHTASLLLPYGSDRIMVDGRMPVHYDPLAEALDEQFGQN